MRGLLGIQLPTESKKNILEKIKKDIEQQRGFVNVISLNPENCVAYFEDKSFKKIVETAQTTIIDGAGVVLAAQILGVPVGERYTGTDLMSELMEWACQSGVSVALIGGKPKIAETISHCYKEKYPEAKIMANHGFNDVFQPKEEEISELNSIVAHYKPQIVFASFGSPTQEKWFEANRALFADSVCIGVGGAFDFLAGSVPRAPKILRTLGLEWFFRLVIQPWRLQRQLRLFKFLWLVILQRLHLLREN